MSLSYNQVIKVNREFAEAHYFLKNFGNGEYYEVVLHNQVSTFKYPLMFMEDLAMPFDTKVEVFGFRVYFMQRVAELEDRGEDLITDTFNNAKSDMLQCAKDFIAFWAQDENYPEFTIELTSSRETFQDQTEDRLTGCYIDVRFRQAFDLSSCNLPMDGITPPPSIVCEPVTMTFNGSGITSTPSGGTKAIIVQNDAGVPVQVGTPILDNVGNLTVEVPAAGADVTSSFNGVGTATDTPPGQNLAIAVTNSTPALIGTLAIDLANAKGITIADSTTENSDQSYQIGVPAEGTLVLPDDDFDVYLDGALQSSVSDPAITNTTINILWT